MLIHQLLEAQAASRPDSIAIESQDECLTYGQLQVDVNRMAHFLANSTTSNEPVIATLLEAGIQLVISMMAIFKSGGVYLPIDISFPQERIVAILQQADVIITNFVLDSFHNETLNKAFFSDQPADTLFQNIGIRVNEKVRENRSDNKTAAHKEPEPDSPAYIFYTSGSTGGGKAVLGCHKGLCHYVRWHITEFSIDSKHRFSQLARITFDASLRDICTALVSGATIVMPAVTVRNNSALLLSWIITHQINIIHCVPSIFRLLIREAELNRVKNTSLPHLKYVIMAGEQLFGKDIIRWRQAFKTHAQLVNFYGSTETTMTSTFFRIREVTNPELIIPIGKPISNTKVAVIKDGKICRTGEIGEVFVKTPYWTKGYLDKAQTAKVFVSNPLSNDSNDLVYKSGDLGRYTHNGDIEIVGRIDDEVKIAGLRVCLSELQSKILSVPGVDEVVITALRNNEMEMELACHFVSPDLTEEQLSAQLNTLLQSTKPTFVLKYQDLPRTLNGKVDKKALSHFRHLRSYEPPINSTEQILEEAWRAILRLEKIGRKARFFDIGGNSLKAMQIIGAIHEKTGISITIAGLYENQTIEALAALIDARDNMQMCKLYPVEEQDTYPVSSEQNGLYTIDQYWQAKLAYKIRHLLVFKNLDLSVFSDAFNQMVTRNEILRTSFVETNGVLRQRVHSVDELFPFLLFKDLMHKPCAQNLVEDVIERESKEPFILGKPPLFRVYVFRLNVSDWKVLFSFHHIICDGWSLQLMSMQLLNSYQLILNGNLNITPPFEIQYKDFAVWQKSFYSSEAYETDKKFWLSKFLLPPQPLLLPLEISRPPIQTFIGKSTNVKFSSELVSALREACTKLEVTTTIFMFAAIKALFFKYTDRTDITIGTIIRGRGLPILEDQLGCYAKILPLRTVFQRHNTFIDLLRMVKSNLLETYDHLHYPYEALVEDLSLKRELSRTPLFDVMVDMQIIDANYRNASVVKTVLDTEEMEVRETTSKFDLTFNFVDTGEELILHFTSNSSLFVENPASNYLPDLFEVIEQCCNDSRIPLTDIYYSSKLTSSQINGDGSVPRPVNEVGDLDEKTHHEFVTPDQLKLRSIFESVLNIKVDSANSHFFEIGGNSLTAMALLARIHLQFDVVIGWQSFMLNASVNGIVKLLEVSHKNAFLPIPCYEEQDYYPLTSIQENIWLETQRIEGQLTYNLYDAFELYHLDINSFNDAIFDLFRRHESIRTNFVTVRGEPKQKVRSIPRQLLPIKHIYLNEKYEGIELDQILATETLLSFDLEFDPLLRCTIIHCAQNRDIVVFAVHHLAVDAYSLDIFKNDFYFYYNKHTNHSTELLPALTIQYRDYACWLRYNERKSENERARIFWTNKLVPERPKLHLPFAKPATTGIQVAGNAYSRQIDGSMYDWIRQTTRTNQLTTFDFMVAILMLSFYKYTYDNRITVGCIVSTRDRVELENQIGLYINTIVLSQDIDPNDTFMEMLVKTSHNIAASLEYKSYSFDKIVSLVNDKKASGKNPFFDILINMVDHAKGVEEMESEVEVSPIVIPQTHSKFALSIYISDTGSIELKFEFKLNHFSKDSIIQYSDNLIHLISSIMADTTKSIDEIKLNTHILPEIGVFDRIGS